VRPLSLQQPPFPTCFCWDFIGGAALIWILFSQSDWYLVILPFVTICLYMAGFFGQITRTFFSIPFISIIGGMCYSIYLTHSAVLSGIHGVLSRMGTASLSVGIQTTIIYFSCAIGVLTVGTLYFVLIERPCMNPNWPQQLSARLIRSPKTKVREVS
jgi:peptidoglycan/LPS O-acetylase OafA/YrhL